MMGICHSVYESAGSTWSPTVPRSLSSDTVIVLRDRDSQHVCDP